MNLRTSWLAWALLGLGCHSFSPVVEKAPDLSLSAEQWWQRGQEAMHLGEIDKAIACYEQGLAADERHTRTHLSLAVAYLESGHQAKASVHLRRFVADQPENRTARAFLAELLLRQRQFAEAKQEFARFIAQAQEEGDRTARERIHGHSRLAELAEAEDNAYDYHLHRGIGLYLLGCCRAQVADQGEATPASESLLCKAAGELAAARLLRPAEARPCWYLYETWRRLAQLQQAQQWLGKAEEAAPFSDLTVVELRNLALAMNPAGENWK